MSGAVALRRGSKPRPTATKRRSQSPRSSLSGRGTGSKPFAPELVRRAVQWLLGLLILIAAVVTIWLMGLPQQLAWETGEALGRAGFAVRQLDVPGVYRLARLPVHVARKRDAEAQSR